MIYRDKIREVFSRFEGKQQIVGYIPCDIAGSNKTANYKGGPDPAKYIPMGVSGVTVGTGVDLGQTDATTLKNIGVSEETIDVVRPYLCKRKMEAVYALHRAPLTLTREQAEELDRCMHNHHIEIISRRYDRDAGVGAFNEIPWQAQAVICSILYQRGVNSPKKFVNTWNALVTRNWKEASERLQNSKLWAGYHSRRKAEGKILEEIAK